MEMQFQFVVASSLILCLFLCTPCANARQSLLVCDALDRSFPFDNSSIFQHIFTLSFLFYFLSCHVHTYINFLQVRFLPFYVNLNLTVHKSSSKGNVSYYSLWLFLLSITINEMSLQVFIAWLFHTVPNIYPFLVYIFDNIFHNRKILQNLLVCCISVNIMASSVTHMSHIISLVTMFITCNWFMKNVPPWVPFLLIMLSNDIELNPGPTYHENFFTVMNWNLNSLVKNNFEPIQLMEASS